MAEHIILHTRYGPAHEPDFVLELIGEGEFIEEPPDEGEKEPQRRFVGKYVGYRWRSKTPRDRNRVRLAKRMDSRTGSSGEVRFQFEEREVSARDEAEIQRRITRRR